MIGAALEMITCPHDVPNEEDDGGNNEKARGRSSWHLDCATGVVDEVLSCSEGVEVKLQHLKERMETYTE